MKPELPSTDDRPIWDVWLSLNWLPSVTVADELGIFSSLAEEPAQAVGLAKRLGFNERGVETLLPLLAALGFLVKRDGRFQITDTTRLYLLHDSPFYWGGVLEAMRGRLFQHAALRDIIRSGTAPRAVSPGEANRPADAWASGQMDLEHARGIARFMHSHSLPAALGAARNGNLAGVKHLLDVGGGSGCFSIAFAQRHPDLRCTVMDLPAMCTHAAGYIDAAGMSDRVDARAVDMFRQAWPRGYDAVFFSNIFHDWSFDTCAELAAKAYALLPAGGRIYLHEMLLNNNGDGPLTAASFSVLMLLGTQGRQFTYAELKTLLEAAGFTDIDVTATYGYYSLVRGFKR